MWPFWFGRVAVFVVSRSCLGAGKFAGSLCLQDVVVLFSQDIGLAVLHLRENGQLDTLRKKWWQDKGECVGDDKKVRTEP